MGWKSAGEELAEDQIRHLCVWRDERRSSLSNATQQMALDAGESLELLVNTLPRSEVVSLRNVLFDPKDGIIALVDSTRENLFTTDAVADALRARLLRVSISHWRWTSSPPNPLQAKSIIESAWSIYKKDRKSSIRVEAIALISALLLPRSSPYFAKDGTGDPNLFPFAERVCSGLREEVQHGIIWNSSSQTLASSVYRLIGGLIWSYGHDLVGGRTAMLAKEFLEATTEKAESLDGPDYKAARAEGALYGLSGVLRFVEADYARLIAISVVPIIRAILASVSSTRYGLKKAALSLLMTSAEAVIDELTKEAHPGELSTGSASTLDSISGITIGVSNGRAIVRSIIRSCEHQNYELRAQSFRTLSAVSKELGAWFEAVPNARSIHPLYRELVNEVARLLFVETESGMDTSSIRAMRISVCILEHMSRTISKLSGEETTRKFLRKLLQAHTFTILLTHEADVWGTDGLYSRTEKLGDYSVQLLSGIGALLSGIKGKEDDGEVAMRIDQTLASVLSDLTNLEEKKRKQYYVAISRLCVVLWDRGEGPLRQSLEQLVYASLMRTADSHSEDVVELRSVKVFHGLWQSLIGSRPDRSDSGSLAPLQRFLFGKLVTSIWNSLNELSLESSGSSELETEWHGEARSATHPSTMQTVYLLGRIVKCLCVLLEVADNGLLQEWAPNLLKESSELLVSNIYQAEFYVLMKAALAACKRVHFLADTNNTLVKDLISGVLESTAGSLLFQGQDTLVNIVEMVLEVPAIWSRTRTDIVVRCISSALELGAVMEEAAQRAMDAIEELLNQDQTFFNHIMRPVILRLLPFVRNDWSSMSSELTRPDRSVNGDWRSLLSHRAVLIIGKMGVDAVQCAKQLVSEPFDLETSFDFGWLDVPEMYFQYSDAEGRVLGLPAPNVGGSVPLPFSGSFQSKELFPHIHTILLLPSLSELIVSNNPEQRVTACELLHAVTVKLVAESSKLDKSAQERKCTTEVFKRLFPMLVKLACDRDDLVRSIFRPLVLQLVHYISSRGAPSPPESSILVEALVECATLAARATASTTSGISDLLAEYIRWSLKHLGDQGLQRPTHDIDALIYRFLALLRDPDEGKRVATISLLLDCRPAFDEHSSALAGHMFQLSKAALESLILYHMSQNDVLGSKIHKARRLNRYLTRLISSELPSSRAEDESGRVAVDCEEHLDWLFKNVFSSSCTGNVREELMWSLHHLLQSEKREMFWLSQRLSYMRDATTDVAATVAGGSSTEQNDALIHAARLVCWMLVSVMKTRADSAFEEREDLDEILFSSVSIISGALTTGLALRDDALRAVLEVCRVVARSFMTVEPLSSLVVSTMSILIAYLLSKEALTLAESRRKSKFVRGPVRDLLREVLVKKPEVRKQLMEAFDREVSSRRSRLTMQEEDDPDLELARSISQGEGGELPDHVLDAMRVLAEHNLLPRARALSRGLCHCAILTWELAEAWQPRPSYANGALQRIAASKLLSTSFETGLELTDLDDVLLIVKTKVTKDSFCHSFATVLHHQIALSLDQRLDYFLERISPASGAGFSETTNAKLLLGSVGSFLLLSARSQTEAQICSKLMSILPDPEKARSMSLSDNVYWISLAKLLLVLDRETTLAAGKKSPVYQLIVGYGLSREARFNSLTEEATVDIRLLAIESLPLFLSDGREELSNEIGDELNALFVEEFPTASSVLADRRQQRKAYDLIILKILSSLEASPFGAAVLFPFLVRTAAEGTSHHLFVAIADAVESMSTCASRKAAKRAFNDVFSTFTDGWRPENVRRAAILDFSIPLIKHVRDAGIVREIAEERLNFLLKFAEAPITKQGSGKDPSMDQYRTTLDLSACSVRLLVELLERLPSDSVRGELNTIFIQGQDMPQNDKTQGSELLKHMLNFGDRVAKGKMEAAYGETYSSSTINLAASKWEYRCAAYNLAAIVILKTLGQQQKFLATLLHPDFIKNIVNTDEDWSPMFTVETSFRRQRSALSSMRKDKWRRGKLPVKYLSTQFLVATNMSQDFQSFVEGEVTTGKSNYRAVDEDGESFDTELDAVNKSICWSYMLQAFHSLFALSSATRGSSKDEESDVYYKHVEKPVVRLAEMISIRSQAHRNVKCFVSKLLLQVYDRLRPTTQETLFKPFVDAAIECARFGEGVHYFLRDLVLQIVSMCNSAIVDNNTLLESADALKDLMVSIAKKILTFNLKSRMWKAVMVANLDLVKELMECCKGLRRVTLPSNVWRAYLSFQGQDTGAERGRPRYPSEVMSSVNDRTKCRLVGLNILYSALSNDVVVEDVKKGFRTIFQLMTEPDAHSAVYESAAQVVGKALSVMGRGDENRLYQNSLYESIEALTIACLERIETDFDKRRSIRTIEKVSAEYGKIARSFVSSMCDTVLDKSLGILRVTVLKCLRRLVQTDESMVKEVLEKLSPHFLVITAGNDSPQLQHGLILLLGNVLSSGGLSRTQKELWSLIRRVCNEFSQHPQKELRRDLFQIVSQALRALRENGEEDAELEKTLFQALIDEDMDCRVVGLRHFHRKLTRNCHERLAALLSPEFYSAGDRRLWISNTLALLLELGLESVDIDYALHERLKGATFEPLETGCSSKSGATENSVVATLSLSQLSSLSRLETAGAPISFMESLTQVAQLGSSTVDPMQPGSAFVSELFASNSNRLGVAKRVRFEEPRKDSEVSTSERFAARAAREKMKKEDEELRKNQRSSAYVPATLLRKYRQGDLPDFEITARTFLEPLKVLAMTQHDIAAELLLMVLKVLYAYEGTTNLRELIRLRICDSFGHLLRSSESSVGIKMLLGFFLNALTYCGASSLAVGTLHRSVWLSADKFSGITALEHAILENREKQGMEHPDKKRKIDAARSDKDASAMDMALISVGQEDMIQESVLSEFELLVHELKDSKNSTDSMLRAEILTCALRLSRWEDVKSFAHPLEGSVPEQWGNDPASVMVAKISTSVFVENNALRLLGLKANVEDGFLKWCQELLEQNTNSKSGFTLFNILREEFPELTIVAALVANPEEGLIDHCLSQSLKRMVVKLVATSKRHAGSEECLSNLSLLVDTASILKASFENHCSVAEAVGKSPDFSWTNLRGQSLEELKVHACFKVFCSVVSSSRTDDSAVVERINRGLVEALTVASSASRDHGDRMSSESLLRLARKHVTAYGLTVPHELQEQLIRQVAEKYYDEGKQDSVASMRVRMIERSLSSAKQLQSKDPSFALLTGNIAEQALRSMQEAKLESHGAVDPNELRRLAEESYALAAEVCAHDEKAGALVRLSTLLRTDSENVAAQPDSLSARRVSLLVSALSVGSGKQDYLMLQVFDLIRHGGRETRKEFREESSNIAVSLLAKWTPHIVGFLFQDASRDGSESASLAAHETMAWTVFPCLMKIAKCRPQVVFFQLRVAEQAHKKLHKKLSAESQQMLSRLALVLGRPAQTLEKFAQQLELLIDPDTNSRKTIVTLLNSLRSQNRQNLTATLRILLDKAFEERSGMGRVHREYALALQRHFVGLCNSLNLNVEQAGGVRGTLNRWTDNAGETELYLGLTPLCEDIRAMTVFDSNQTSAKLRSYSPWLASYVHHAAETEDAFALEVPGSMENGNHAKIVLFDQSLRVMQSKQRPKVLGMIGADQKQYSFLVKGGEDLRTDEHVQRIFRGFNRSLAALKPGQGSRLAVYSVVPVSVDCGLIEWVSNTVSVRSLLEDDIVSLENHELKTAGKEAIFLTRAARIHMHTILHGSPPSTDSVADVVRFPLAADYLRAFDQVSNDKARQSQLMQECFSNSYLLQMRIMRLCASPRSFLMIRNRLVRSLVVNCIAGYFLGIGDRHLDNILIDLKRLNVVSVDFGYSLGSSMGLPVPELLPFRFTAQFQHLISPRDPVQVFVKLMSKAIQCIVQDADDHLIECETFASDVLDQVDVQYAVSSTRAKLNRKHPLQICLIDLRKHAKPEAFELLRRNVYGGVNVGRLEEVKVLSPTDQAMSLVEMATNPCLLARTYYGSTPWL
ncbi:hypothetical protein NDN08_001473 [Rhodosorus marinus]|uniref:Non-specific serine/threonine protein kinase n=1 Tax=Rhodosorus marinus TaxID=101924 RepID=A0AAV8UQV8_9RHOD|nr:hypothetical protein NDN08_001473 [Rhodosorus marinus]